MWFKFYNRKNWALRFFRTYNLRYDYDINSLYAFHSVSKLNNLIQRTIFTDSTLRAVVMALMLSAFSMYSWYAKRNEDPEEIARQKELDEQETQDQLNMIRNELRLNR